MPEELPAVTWPCGRNGVLSPPSASIVVPGLGASSSTARPQPRSAVLIAVGTRSGWILSSAYALAAFSCDSTAYASARSLVIVG